jgi:hypothetical protein
MALHTAAPKALQTAALTALMSGNHWVVKKADWTADQMAGN